MKATLSVFGIATTIPALLLAIALGPVAAGILCAVGFGFLVFALGNLMIALGVGAERAGSWLVRHRPGS